MPRFLVLTGGVMILLLIGCVGYRVTACHHCYHSAGKRLLGIKHMTVSSRDKISMPMVPSTGKESPKGESTGRLLVGIASPAVTRLV